MSRIKNWIIGAVGVAILLTLGGCSSVRLAYNSGPTLAWFWIDGYFDFSREQNQLVKRNLELLWDWHRSTQLLEFVPLLQSAQAEVTQPATPAQACRWQDQVREKLEPTLQRTLLLAAEIVPRLGEAQFKALDKRYAKGNAEMRKDFMQPDPAERLAEAAKRTLDRAERLYGNLDDAQKKVIAAGMAASPFNPELWLTERLRRQRDTVQTLRRLVNERADTEARVAALRTLVNHVERSPDPEYRAYQIKLGEFNCALAAQLHNATTVAQRRHARETLKGWEEDFRALSLNE